MLGIQNNRGQLVAVKNNQGQIIHPDTMINNQRERIQYPRQFQNDQLTPDQNKERYHWQLRTLILQSFMQENSRHGKFSECETFFSSHIKPSNIAKLVLCLSIDSKINKLNTVQDELRQVSQNLKIKNTTLDSWWQLYDKGQLNRCVQSQKFALANNIPNFEYKAQDHLLQLQERFKISGYKCDYETGHAISEFLLRGQLRDDYEEATLKKLASKQLNNVIINIQNSNSSFKMTRWVLERVKQFDSGECAQGRTTNTVEQQDCVICHSPVDNIPRDQMMRNWRMNMCCNRIVHRWCIFEYFVRRSDNPACPNCRESLGPTEEEITDQEDDTLELQAIQHAQINDESNDDV